jgi:hypothetical protein
MQEVARMKLHTKSVRQIIDSLIQQSFFLWLRISYKCSIPCSEKHPQTQNILQCQIPLACALFLEATKTKCTWRSEFNYRPCDK